MACYYSNKCFLMGQDDLPLYTYCTLEDIADFMFEYLEEIFGEAIHPELDLVGVCSQGEDRTWYYNPNRVQSKWLRPNMSWNQALGCVTAERLAIDQSTAQNIITEAVNAETTIREKLMTYVQSRQYSALQHGVEAILALEDGCAPGFLPLSAFTKGTKDQAIDMRENREKPDRRLLVEVAFLWHPRLDPKIHRDELQIR